MKIKKIFLISTLVVGFNSASIAGTYYFGAGSGPSDVNTTVGVGTASLDETDVGYKFYAGYHFNEHFSIEAFYNNFGTATLSGSNGKTFSQGGTDYQFTATADIDLDVWSVGITPMLGYEIPINEGNIKSIRPFVKAGIQRWEGEIDVTTTSTNATFQLDNDLDIILGVGAFINFDFHAPFLKNTNSNNGFPMGFKGEYEFAHTEDEMKIMDNLNMFTASLFLNF